MHQITFLGTGGGRFVILTQRRYSGGLWLEFDDDLNIVVDPGPGSLVRALQFKKKPYEIDAVFVSHNHLDHYSDTEVLIEAMTKGVKENKGFLVTTKETTPYFSDYHKKAVNILTPEPDETFQIKDLKIKALPTFFHKNAIGFKFFTKKGIVTYSSDTAFREDLIKNYKGSKILILNTIFPHNKEIDTHLNTTNALKIISGVRPKTAIITHFGMQMLNSNPKKEAKIIEEKTGVETIAARDGMEFFLDKTDKEREKSQKKLDSF